MNEIGSSYWKKPQSSDSKDITCFRFVDFQFEYELPIFEFFKCETTFGMNSQCKWCLLWKISTLTSMIAVRMTALIVWFDILYEEIDQCQLDSFNVTPMKELNSKLNSNWNQFEYSVEIFRITAEISQKGQSHGEFACFFM